MVGRLTIGGGWACPPSDIQGCARLGNTSPRNPCESLGGGDSPCIEPRGTSYQPDEGGDAECTHEAVTPSRAVQVRVGIPKPNRTDRPLE